MSEIEDRRQRAREAAYDVLTGGRGHSEARAGIEVAIEAATQVKITREATDAFRNCDVHEIQDPDFMHLRLERRLAAALAALGFEVIE